MWPHGRWAQCVGIAVFAWTLSRAGPAQAIPSPELVIGTLSSISQVFAVLSALLGGGAVAAGVGAAGRSSKRSRLTGWLIGGFGLLALAELEVEIRERRALENDLRRALGNGEFELHYQPIVDLASRQVTYCEALLRWRHPVRGNVTPAVFIPIAEELGLISAIGAWVLRRACEEAQTWPEHVGVAVNLSAQQFEVDDVFAVTLRALSLSGLCPSRLELEVTETLLLADKSETNGTLMQLRDLGVGIALDDFGTGYASLSYLRSFPFDKIKIDQSFVRELPERAECFSIVSAICEMARSLGMRTVAEGVETGEHIDWVKRSGCDLVQGYHFSRPVPASEIVAVIDACEQRFVAAA